MSLNMPMNKEDGPKGDLLYYGAILLFTILFWHKLISFKSTLFFDNIFKLFYPYMSFLGENLRRFSVPLWNPYIYSGLPFAANPQAGVFYPLNLLFALKHYHIAANLSILVHSFLSGIFMFKFSRAMGLPRKASIITSFLYMFNGFAVLHVEFFSNFFSYTWLPIIFYSFREGIINQNKKMLLLSACFLALQFFAGFPTFTYFTLLALMCFILFKKLSNLSLHQKFFYMVLVAIVFCSIIAVLLLPVLDFIPYSIRHNGLSFEEITTYSLKPFELVRFLLFPLWTYYYVPVSGDPHIVGHYFGMVSLIPFIIGAVLLFKRREHMWIYIPMFISAFLSFGNNVPGYKYLISIFPFLKLFRFPAQWMIIFVFCYTLTVGFGINKIKSKLFIILVILLLPLELYLFSNKVLRYIPTEFFKTKFPNVELLKKDKELFRFLLTPKTRRVSHRIARNYSEAWYKFANSLYPNSAMLFHLFDTDGFETLRFKKYQELINRLSRDPNSKIIDMLNIKYLISFWLLESKKYELVNYDGDVYIYKNVSYLPRVYFVQKIKFLSASKIIDYIESKSCDLLKEVIIDEGLRDSELMDLRDDMDKDFKITNIIYNPNSISFDINTTTPGIVVVSDAWDTNWKARVNGKRVVVYPVNYTLRGLKVNRGTSHIVMRYLPNTFIFGIIISAVSLLLLVIYFFILKHK